MSHVAVPCGTCRACCKAPWFVRLMPWEKEKHGGVDVLPHKGNGDCVYLEDGCSLFGKPERPHACKLFDCRDKVREWKARGSPVLEAGLAAVILSGIRLGKK